MNRIKAIAVSLMLSLSAICHAAESDELVATVMNTSAAIPKVSMVHEYSALFYRYKGVVFATPLRTDKDPVAVLLPSVYELPVGAFLLGLFHTHPCVEGYDTFRLSDVDINTAKFHMRPSFVMDLCSGEVHVWNPILDKETNPSGRRVGTVQLPIKVRIVIPVQLPATVITGKKPG